MTTPKGSTVGVGLGDVFRDEETETLCPACGGSTFEEIAQVAPGRYRVRQCHVCDGAGMITATKASEWRMKRPTA